MGETAHGLVGVADAGAFLARLVRLDRAAVVRLRSTAGARRTVLWAPLPWRVLVTRAVAGPGPGDATVGAADLLAALDGGGDALPQRRDAQWRWPVPGGAGRVVESVPVEEFARVASAAAGTLRAAVGGSSGGRALGERAVRDALLDHVPIIVTGAGDDAPIEVPQRLVQAVVQMGFLGGPPASEPIRVRRQGGWTGLSAPYGTAWIQSVTELAVRPSPAHTNG